MTDPINDLFDNGLERYKAGEGPDTLLPVFKDICDRSPKLTAAWICLSWLYLLDDQSTLAYKAAQKAVKLNPQDPQAHINLALAMLEEGKTGVRQHIEEAQRSLAINPELRPDIQESIEDGLARKPDWKGLNRVKNWLFT
jgi:tetratricopeptide (TPR) repeat protein